jgi:hypothetical protein
MRRPKIVLNIPGRNDYLDSHSGLYGATLQSAEGSALFTEISSTKGAIRCICATADGLPALAGIERMAVRRFEKLGYSWTDQLKHFAGTVVAVVMRANGFQSTGQQLRTDGVFGSGEMFELCPGCTFLWEKAESA